jgi:hypothetical protein
VLSAIVEADGRDSTRGPPGRWQWGSGRREYGPWIPALSGRRVLLADDSDPERRKAREWIAASRDAEQIRSAAERFHVTHLAWGRLDALDPLAIDFEFLESSPLFSLVHQQRRWVRVFEIRAPTN